MELLVLPLYYWGFLGTQYDVYDRLKKGSYVIEKDLYVRIWRLRLIYTTGFFSFVQ
jgi:hypothetical protein